MIFFLLKFSLSRYSKNIWFSSLLFVKGQHFAGCSCQLLSYFLQLKASYEIKFFVKTPCQPSHKFLISDPSHFHYKSLHYPQGHRLFHVCLSYFYLLYLLIDLLKRSLIHLHHIYFIFLWFSVHICSHNPWWAWMQQKHPLDFLVIQKHFLRAFRIILVV